MSDLGRPGRGGRRRIAGQRRPADRRAAAPGPDDATTEGPGEQDAIDEGPGDDQARAAEPVADDTEPAEVSDDGGSADEDADKDTDKDDGPGEDSDGDDDPAVDGEEAVGAAAPARRGGRLTAALAVLLVLTLAGAGIVGVQAWQGRKAEQSRSAATTAARKAAEAVLSYDYRQLDKSFSEARALLTPEFAADFDKTAKVVGEQATKTKATVRAEVREVGVKEGDADRMTLLVFVNQTTTSTITQGKPRVDLNRARFTMVRGNDGWQVQQIDGL